MIDQADDHIERRALPWIGKATPLKREHMAAAAERLKCTEAEISTIIRVEAGGVWFTDSGALAMRFEPHHVKAEIRNSITWVSDWRASMSLSRATREALFWRVYAKDEEAAMRATSWGGPQMMGFNHSLIGYDSARQMVMAFADSAAAQLGAMVRFIIVRGLERPLRERDWASFAVGYNGPANAEVYASKLATAHEQILKSKQKRTSARKIIKHGATLRLGRGGRAVREVQDLLNKVSGSGLVVDGIFGPKTHEAVMRFQIMNQLSVDGIVGKRTWKRLVRKAEKINSDHNT